MQLILGLNRGLEDYFKSNSLEYIGYPNKWRSLYTVLYTFIFTHYMIENIIIYLYVLCAL